MKKIPVIAIFDIGKTNKKLLLFDEQYRIVFEYATRLPETADEDGDPCENLESLRHFVFDTLQQIRRDENVRIAAINFSAYGASMVHIDEQGRALTPLYNYLKPYPAALSDQFYSRYGGSAALSLQTASPVLGSLNAGMQLYRLKYEQPLIFRQLKYALHLPQYMSYLLTGVACSDKTSIGCHTHLWDFQRNDYHTWVTTEGVKDKLAPVFAATATMMSDNGVIGVGLHDSSAALIPYLVTCSEPFALISTGTWCICLNPFNNIPLTTEELAADCLCYLSFEGKPVKASRLFAGHEYEQQVKRIANHFHQHTDRYQTMEYNDEIIQQLKEAPVLDKDSGPCTVFEQRHLDSFASDTIAYHQLMMDIAREQYIAAMRVLKDTPVKRIYVDGGFSKNRLYMQLLANMLPEMEIFAASMPQATAMGAALAIHEAWNHQAVPADLVTLKPYRAARCG
ncbi:FGGY-family carbohydrate kinase [Chitinophaga vietnamensis]|uniref:FGGY-family carbohydrate kinase n=1 Tax=Chitinophaga vietnamensis TaxID=2593957 RepID=UPI001177BD18|nr:FGGY family carbohydrate kinase [Chitinophaga vietnamensis]